jgi:hypothetical protein
MLRPLVPGFLQRWPGFRPRSVNLEFVVDKVELGRVGSQHFGSPLPILIPPALHTHWSSYHRHSVVSMFAASLNNQLKELPALQKSYCVPITKTIWLVLLTEIITVYSEDRIKHLNKICVKMQFLKMVKQMKLLQIIKSLCLELLAWWRTWIVQLENAAIARQRSGKHVSAASNQHAKIEELLEVVFSMGSEPKAPTGKNESVGSRNRRLIVLSLELYC